MAELKKDLNPELFYNDINNLISKNIVDGSPNSTIFANDISKLANERSKEFFNSRYNRDCRVEYTDYHTEYMICMIALMSMSWSIVNLRNKTENGHCQNNTPDHRHPNKNPPLCHSGSQFHKEFYDDLIISFENILNKARSNSPEALR
jgi:hypothetical protein